MSRALVVGISQYKSQAVSSLTSAERDARRVAAALEAQAFEVQLLVGRRASKAAILDGLDLLIDRSTADDRLLVYFAGHGETRGEGDTLMGFLAPHDYLPGRQIRTGISMKTLVEVLRTSRAQKRLLLADACYSGLALPRTRAIRPAQAPGSPSRCPTLDHRPVTAVIVAGSKAQVAHETDTGGVFTQALLDILAGRTKADADEDGWVSHHDLGYHLRRTVKATVAYRWRRTQEPQLGMLGDGDFLLRVAPPQPGGPSADSGAPATVIGAATPAPVEAPFQYPVTLAFGLTAVAGAALGLTSWRLLEGANDEAERAGSEADFNDAKDDADLFFGLQMTGYALAGVGAVGALVSFLVEREPAAPSALRWQAGPGFVGVQGRF